MLFSKGHYRYLSRLQSFFPKPGGFLRSKGLKEQNQFGVLFLWNRFKLLSSAAYVFPAGQLIKYLLFFIH